MTSIVGGSLHRIIITCTGAGKLKLASLRYVKWLSILVIAGAGWEPAGMEWIADHWGGEHVKDTEQLILKMVCFYMICCMYY